VQVDEKTETIMHWIHKATIQKGSGTIKIHLDNDLRPYLLQLKDHFTQYSLYYTLAMRNKYSIRFYELLKSYENLRSWNFAFEELNTKLCAETYTRLIDFKRRVLEPSIKEINAYSDINVDYKIIKIEPKKYQIEFKIKAKGTKERIEAFKNVETRLNPKGLIGQINMFQPTEQGEEQ
jgi:plasmid replication initiation protein